MRIARAQPHRRELKSSLRVDEMATDSLGRLRLKGVLSEPQYLAGSRYAVFVGQYRSTIEAPRSTSGSGRGFDCCFGTDTDCECLSRRRRYDRAYVALYAAGRRCALAVNRVTIQGAELGPLDLIYLLAGLAALAKHFALTERRARGNVEIQIG